jgi:hypothetical protein
MRQISFAIVPGSTAPSETIYLVVEGVTHRSGPGAQGESAFSSAARVALSVGVGGSEFRKSDWPLP